MCNVGNLHRINFLLAFYSFIMILNFKIMVYYQSHFYPLCLSRYGTLHSYVMICYGETTSRPPPNCQCGQKNMVNHADLASLAALASPHHVHQHIRPGLSSEELQWNVPPLRCAATIFFSDEKMPIECLKSRAIR